jgi:glycosyltransferase involved in cell wall biosynthesis
MINIGFDAKRAFYNSRGLGNYSRDTIRIVSEFDCNNNIYLFTPKVANAIPVTYSSNCKIVSPEKGFYKRFSSLWRLYGQNTQIEKLRLDVYHGLSHELPLGIEKTGARAVVTMHDLIFFKMPELYPFIDRQLYKKKYFRSCKVADKIVAISQQTKQDLIDLIGIDEGKIEVIYQGCNPIFLDEKNTNQIVTAREQYGLPQDYLLCVGAIEKRKNQELILKAMAHGQLDITLVLIGKPTDYVHELKTIIARYKMENRVKFLENVPTADLPAIYQGATAFVYPSHFEGFGIPILEALNSRIPVITSKGSCFEETGGADSLYVDSHRSDELSCAIKKVLDDASLRQKMIRLGLSHANKFSDATIGKSMISLYQSLL